MPGRCGPRHAQYHAIRRPEPLTERNACLELPR
jgi:hypothetical protein